MAERVSIQTQDFDLSTEVAALRGHHRGVGAVCSFIGTVRDRNEGQSVSTMELEHYPARYFMGRHARSSTTEEVRCNDDGFMVLR